MLGKFQLEVLLNTGKLENAVYKHPPQINPHISKSNLDVNNQSTTARKVMAQARSWLTRAGM